jgi:hypothetical protein
MNLYTNDTYQEINKGNSSAVGLIVRKLKAGNIGNLYQTPQEQEEFAIEYSNIKTQVLLHIGFDWKFAIYDKVNIITSQEIDGTVIHSKPSNFLRFTRNLKHLGECSNKDIINNFSYIGYVKDINPQKKQEIPSVFYDIVGYNFLLAEESVSPQLKAMYFTQLMASYKKVKEGGFAIY